MKFDFIVSIVLLCVILTACNEKSVYDPEAGRKVEELEIPADFTWTMTKNVKLILRSNAETEVAVYSDKDCSVLLSEMTVTPEGDTCSLNVEKSVSTLYVAYVQENGKETIAPVNISILTRGVEEDNWIGSWEIKDAEKNAFDGIKSVAYFPSQKSCGTLLFEDMWPVKGDYDFNDVAVWYQIRLSSKKDKNQALEEENEIQDVKKVEIAVRLNALGGDYPCQFCLQFGEDSDEIKQIEVESKGSGQCIWENEGKKEDAIFVFDWPGIKTERFYNTENVIGNAELENNWVVLTIWLGEEDVDFDDFDFFIRRTDNQYEIHLKGYEPTDEFEHAYKDIVKENRDSLKQDDDYAYSTWDNYVWGINVPWAINHAKENVDFCTAYDDFAVWILSNGKSAQNWYKMNKSSDKRINILPSNHNGVYYFDRKK